MKKVVCGILITLSLFFCMGCKEVNTFKLVGIIQNIGDKIEVEVVSSEYASGIYLVITGENTKYYNEEEKEIEKTNLSVGDKIQIIYGGQVMMSYPPQIVAKKIVLK